MSHQIAVMQHLTSNAADWTRRWLILTLMLLVPVSTLCAPASANVITDWNTIASAIIVAQGGKPSAAGGVWFAYEAIAVYDAVNSVHHEFQPFYYHGSAAADGSDEAAGIAAAHRVLVNFCPGATVHP